jgi:putative endonuclease
MKSKAVTGQTSQVGIGKPESVGTQAIGGVRPVRANGNTRSRGRRPTGRRTANQLLGAAAEQLAADFLRAQGLEILERNYLRRLGELDIVAREDDVLVIAEVRCRSSDRFGGAAASVDTRKQMRLIRAASQLLQQHRELSHLRVRFDVLAIAEVGRETARVEWIRHAFST